MGDSAKRALPPGFPEPKQDTERLLLERLQNSKTEEDYFRWLLFVVAFYRGIEKVESARALLQLFLETGQNNDHKAHCHLALGQIATDEQRFETALNHFVVALKINPTQASITYVLHNNAGYCLNKLARYKDAERHCRLAIGINSGRPAAYRNLGISLEGQCEFVSAAWALVEAVKADSSDERAQHLLAKLVEGRPALRLQCPWIDKALGLSDNPPVGGYCV